LLLGDERGIKITHILPEQLVLYVEAKDELTKEDFAKIKAHVNECSDCQKELQILKDVNASMKQSNMAKFLVILKNKISDLFPRMLIGPALAYLIILILLYPAYLGIFKSGKLYEPNVTEINFELIQFDSRSVTQTENEIALSTNTDIFSLSFNIPVLNKKNIRYDAKILDSNGKLVWEIKDIKSLDDYGTFLVIGHRKFFAEGCYKLTVNEINKIENRVQETFVFSFKIVIN